VAEKLRVSFAYGTTYYVVTAGAALGGGGGCAWLAWAPHAWRTPLSFPRLWPLAVEGVCLSCNRPSQYVCGAKTRKPSLKSLESRRSERVSLLASHSSRSPTSVRMKGFVGWGVPVWVVPHTLGIVIAVPPPENLNLRSSPIESVITNVSIYYYST